MTTKPIEVHVAGPNLQDQSKGTFQIHKPGCSHLNRIGGGRGFTIKASSRQEVVEYLFADFLDDNWQAFEPEVFFSPCCSL